MKTTEIARALGTSGSTVSNWIKRGIKVTRNDRKHFLITWPAVRAFILKNGAEPPVRGIKSISMWGIVQRLKIKSSTTWAEILERGGTVDDEEPAEADDKPEPKAKRARKKMWSVEATLSSMQLADEGARDQTIWEYCRDEHHVGRPAWLNMMHKHPKFFEELDRRRSARPTAASSSAAPSPAPAGGEATWSETELQELSKTGLLRLEELRTSLTHHLSLTRRLKDPDNSFPIMAVTRRLVEGFLELVNGSDSETSSVRDSGQE